MNAIHIHAMEFTAMLWCSSIGGHVLFSPFSSLQSPLFTLNSYNLYATKYLSFSLNVHHIVASIHIYSATQLNKIVRGGTQRAPLVAREKSARAKQQQRHQRQKPNDASDFQQICILNEINVMDCEEAHHLSRIYGKHFNLSFASHL